MVTKKKIATIVMKPFSGGLIKDYRKIDPRDVFEIIATVWNEMVANMFAEYGDIDGEFVTRYKNVPVECDSDTKVKYSVLPARLLSFGERSGLRQVSPMRNQSESFIIMQNGGENTHAPLESSKLHGNVGCYLEREKVGTDQSIRIYYKNIPTDYSEVLIKMIAPVSDYAEDENLPIPAKYEKILIEKVGQHFDPTFKIPQDTKSDLSPES